MADLGIVFVRLTEIDVADVAALLNEPRNARHLPLGRGDSFTIEEAASWVTAKDDQWESNGFGPWAVLIDGAFAGPGLGGFQAEENGTDFALVLSPPFWGRGDAIPRFAFDRGFRELKLDSVLIALPLTRNLDRVVAPYGFVPDGEVVYADTPLRQYRLTRAAWLAHPRR